MIVKELQSSSYQTALVAQQVIGVLASIEKSKEGKYNALSQYLHSSIEDDKLVIRILIDVLKQK